MGVASGRGKQEVGVASGWNLRVWVPCIGVVSGCCCNDIFPTPLVLALFLAAASLLPCSFKKYFFSLVSVIFYNI